MPFKLIPSSDNTAPVIQCSEGEEVPKAFFETELQEDKALAQHLLNLALAQDKPQSEFSGNLYNMLIYKSNFTIENLFDEKETFTGDRTFLTEILKQWLALIDQN
ncbi:MAG: hypothetical protein JKY12_03460 [Sneathiella sp.]|nr:hypothetical protein [Sneathiella sp.]